MDRRHVAAVVALTASVATSESGPAPPPGAAPLYRGSTRTDTIAFSLHPDDPTRVWVVRYVAELDEALVNAGFATDLAVELHLAAPDVEPGGSTPVTATLTDCEDGRALAEADLDPWADFQFFDFPMCSEPGTCTTSFCVSVATRDETAGVEMFAWIDVASNDDAPDGVPSIEVPVQIDISELQF
jgi:hypothetical protein